MLYYVIDPANDPMASLQYRDRKTYKGVEEVYDGSYLHQDYERPFKQSEAKVDGMHHYNATK